MGAIFGVHAGTKFSVSFMFCHVSFLVVSFGHL